MCGSDVKIKGNSELWYIYESQSYNDSYTYYYCVSQQ